MGRELMMREELRKSYSHSLGRLRNMHNREVRWNLARLDPPLGENDNCILEPGTTRARSLVKERF